MEWNPLEEAFKVDPYPTYDALREQHPLYQSPFGPLLLSRYEDCLAVLRHPAASSDFRKSPAWSPPPGTPADSVVLSFLSLDPPDHTRLRGLVNRAFTPQQVERLRPRMQAIVDAALERALAQRGMEVVADLAFPFPVLIICEMLGVPPEDVDRFKQWSAAAVRGLDPDFTMTPDVVGQVRDAYGEAHEYLRQLVATRRSDPRDDLLSSLLEVEQQGDRLSEAELVVTLWLLLIAGHETTVNLIANGVLAFARYPEQLARLRDDPSLARSAVEEVLRFYPPVHLDGRLPLEDIEVSVGTVRAFSELTLVLAAANRDPRQFDEPERFDIGRANNRHLGFGFGIHHCVGAPLARLEGQIALASVARHVARIEVVREPPPYKDTVTLPGVASLEVELAA